MNALQEKQLVIVAGPNGAGKSTYSGKFSGKDSVVYDPDKESQKIRQKYQNLPAESIHYFINSHFQDLVASAIKSKKDFILETNFRDYQLMDIAEQFRNNGYSANLMYFLLTSEKESMHRVTSRVRNGGHFVDLKSISLNYDEGLKNLQHFANRFDRVLIIDASARIGEQEPLLNLEGNKIKFINPNIPAWAESTIQQLMATVLSNRETGKGNDPSSGLAR
jgi:predicted ABC-type ATPase